MSLKNLLINNILSQVMKIVKGASFLIFWHKIKIHLAWLCLLRAPQREHNLCVITCLPVSPWCSSIRPVLLLCFLLLLPWWGCHVHIFTALSKVKQFKGCSDLLGPSHFCCPSSQGDSFSCGLFWEPLSPFTIFQGWVFHTRTMRRS